MGRGGAAGAGWLSMALSPLAGAGLVCPDTSYAVLSPFAGRHRLGVAAGSYAGFKLLVPAGPLLVGSGLGAAVGSPRFLLLGLGLLAPTAAAGLGLLWPRARVGAPPAGPEDPRPGRGFSRFLPLGCLAALLGARSVPALAACPLLGFFSSPAGAMLATGLATGALLEATARRACLGAAVERAAPLLLVIGAASALGPCWPGPWRSSASPRPSPPITPRRPSSPSSSRPARP